MGKVYTDTKIASNSENNHIMVSFTDDYNCISIDRLPSKTISKKVHVILIILFYVSPSSSPLQSCFKENAKILSKNSSTQENITISRPNLLFYLKTKKVTTFQQMTGGKIPNLVLKKMLERFLKIHH